MSHWQGGRDNYARDEVLRYHRIRFWCGETIEEEYGERHPGRVPYILRRVSGYDRDSLPAERSSTWPGRW